MRGTVIVAALVLLGACGGDDGHAQPCDMTVDANVDHLVAIIDDEAAWDEWAITLFDECPGKHLLVRERLDEIADQADG